MVKNPLASAGDLRDTGSIPGSRRSPERGHGNPLQDSSLENPMDRRAWPATAHRVAKSRIRLKRLSLGSNLLKYCFCFVLCFGFLAMSHVGFSSLRIKPEHPAMEGEVLIIGPPRKSHLTSFLVIPINQSCD